MQEVLARYSNDKGRSWSEPNVLMKLPQEIGGWGFPVIFADKEGEIHLFLLNDANTGILRPLTSADARQAETYQSRLDIWHTRSTGGRKSWQLLKMIWRGRAGDLQMVTQLRSGRIIVPMSFMTRDRTWSNRGEGFYAFTFTGKFSATTLYSDDGGNNWHLSKSVLRVATPDITTILGAVEPVVIELKDGRVWMLIRTQRGRFYESFSANGVEWSLPQATEIISSDSPAGLLRLLDGTLMLI